MKYDCTKAKDFFHEITRLKEWCRDKSSCGTCGLKPPCPLGCAPSVYDWGGLSDDVFTNLIGILQEWSDSHPEKRELTNDERTILKTLHIVGYRYIARDNDCILKVFNVKPIKDSGGGFWYLDEAPKNYMPVYMPIGKYFTSFNFDGLFDGLFSFDDEEPAEIEELLK